MKKILTLLFVPVLLLFAGAGCQGEPSPAPTSPSTTNATPHATPTAEDEFNFKAEVFNPGIVHFTWDAPKAMDSRVETFLLLHSAKPDPTYPGAYWYRRSGVDREGVWGNIPAGKRYFRICEARDNTCINYSKTVELDIPAGP